MIVCLGCYTDETHPNGLKALQLDEKSGAMAIVAEYPVSNALYQALSPDGKWLYSCTGEGLDAFRCQASGVGSQDVLDKCDDVKLGNCVCHVAAISDDGAEARIAAAWKSRLGEPYAERAVRPPAFKGHPPIARDYSASIINFALRVFHNGETNFFALANRKLAENCRYYIDNTEVRDDRDSFYCDIGQLCRIVYHYGSRGDVKPGLLEPETEAVFREMAFGYCNDLSRVADADPGRTWHVWESGNHHVQRASAFWQLLHLLANLDPSCGATVLKDGHSLDEHCRAWSDFFRAWMRERARRSMFIEVQSRCYGIYTIKNLYPLYDFSDDPSLRRLARDFLDLFWALWAQEQIGGAQGGGMSRVYSVQGRRTAAAATRWAYWYFGIAGVCRPGGIDYVCIDSAYRPSALVCELARDVAARGVYEIESRPLGWALPEDRHPDYRPDPEWGRIYRYTYATPDFIVGTLMFPQAPSKDWCAISSQNRFQSVVYGPPNAQLIPLPAPLGRHSLEKKPPTTAKNAFWSLQRKGTLITRRNRFAGSAGTMQVWFSAAGGVDRVEKDGDWHFIRCGNALSAVRVVCGGSRLVTAGPEDREVTCEQEGKFLVCEDKMSPVIVETARLGDFADEAAFREKVKSTELRLGDSTLDYVGIFGNRFHMDLGDGGASTVDGEPYVRKTEWSFRSPFVQELWNEGVVRLRFAGKEQELDFRDSAPADHLVSISQFDMSDFVGDRGRAIVGDVPAPLQAPREIHDGRGDLSDGNTATATYPKVGGSTTNTFFKAKIEER